MANLRSRVPQLLVVALGILIAVWYFNLEWEEKEVDRGPTAEARRNPVLALQRLLEQRDMPVELVRGFAGLQRLQFDETEVGPNDTLVLLNTGRSLREAQVERLWQWMENGGRVLVTVDNPYFDMTALDSDPLLDRLGLELVGDYWSDLADDEAEDDSDDPQTEETESETAEQAETSPLTSEEEEPEVDRDLCTEPEVALPVSLPGQEDSDLLMEFVSGVAFADVETEATALSYYGEDLFLVHQPVGAGEIFAVPSMAVLANSYIHCQDNAYVLWQMLRNSDKVWLVINVDSPSFWRHLWQLSTFGCIALLCALALWLWHRVPRFGPILERKITGRRQFLDHIQASAQFLFRQQGNAALITPLREEILQKLRLRHPNFSQQPVDDQIAKVVKLSGMTRDDVHLALYRALPVPDPVFIDMVQRLQHLRNTL